MKRINVAIAAGVFAVGVFVMLLVAPLAPRADADSHGQQRALTKHFDLATVWPAAQTGLTLPLRVAMDEDGEVAVFDIADESVALLGPNGSLRQTWVDRDRVGHYPPKKDPGPINARPLRGNDFIVVRRNDQILPDGLPVPNQIERIRQDGTSVWAERAGVLPVTAHPDRLWTESVTVLGEQLLYLNMGQPAVGAVALDSARPSEHFVYLPPAHPRNGPTDELGWYVDVDTLTDGRVALLEQSTGQLHLRRTPWSPDQRIVSTQFEVAGRPIRIARSDENTVFVLDVQGVVREYDVDGQIVSVFDARGPAPNAQTTISDLDITPDGNVVVADASTGQIYVYEPTTVEEGYLPGVAGGCSFERDKRASPPVLPLGREVEVVLTLEGDCPSPVGTDFILMIQRRERAEDHETVLTLAEALVDVIDLDRDRAGVVSYTRFGTNALEQTLTSDRRALSEAIERIPLEVSPPLTATYEHSLGFNEAQMELSGSRGRPGAERVMLVFTTGMAHPGSIVKDALSVRAEGTRLVSVSSFPRQPPPRIKAYGYDEALMLPRYIASGWWDYYVPADVSAEDPKTVRRLYNNVSARAPMVPSGTIAAGGVLTDVIPPEMHYVPGSAQPEATWSPEVRMLTWQLGPVARSGYEARYRLTPQQIGRWPTNVEARAVVTDALGYLQQILFPIPEVEVLAPTPTASATATPTPEPTATASPAPSATPMPTISTPVIPTATPDAPLTRELYLPVVLNDSCVTASGGTDVAVVIDASSSMSQHTPAGRPKIEAAREAARYLIGLLDLAPDQATVVSFNAAAAIEQPLTTDAGLLSEALARLVVRPQTRIDLGIAAAHRELTSERHQLSNRAVLIVLTDGRANPVPAEVAVERAAEAKAAGITVFAIGIGDDLDIEALRRIASQSERFYRTPDAEQLAAIYAEITGQLACPRNTRQGARARRSQPGRRTADLVWVTAGSSSGWHGFRVSVSALRRHVGP